MDKIKRIIALAGVILLVGMYVLTLISGIMVTPYTQSLFKGCIAATIIIPVFLYAYKLVYEVILNKDKDDDKDEKK